MKNRLPRGFGTKLKTLIRQGYSPRDAMRVAWGRRPYAEPNRRRKPRRNQATTALWPIVNRPRRRRSRAKYCPERLAPPRRFDRRSLRTIKQDGHRVTIGCPTGKYDARRKRCKVGTRAQRILHPAGERGTCPIPGLKVGNQQTALLRMFNPPRGAVKIYDRILEIHGQKGRGSAYAGQSFRHPFNRRAAIWGLPSGALLIGPAR